MTNNIELQTGDIVMLATNETDPVSKAVADIDGSDHDGTRYSHAGLVEVDDTGTQWLVSATTSLEICQRIYPSGVTRLPLDAIPRARLVLRLNNGSKAVAEARRWVEEPGPSGGRNPSDFGALQIVLASLIATARHLKDGRLGGRRYLWRFAHAASRRLIGQSPVYDYRRPDPDLLPVDMWHCAAFVDHAFGASGDPLVISEGDPDEQRPRQVLMAYLSLARGLLDKLLDPTEEATSAVSIPSSGEELTDDALSEAVGTLEGVEGTFGLASDVRSVLARLGAAVGGVDLADGDDSSDLVWPPFMSLRLMIAQLEPFIVGTIPAPPAPDC